MLFKESYQDLLLMIVKMGMTLKGAGVIEEDSFCRKKDGFDGIDSVFRERLYFAEILRDFCIYCCHRLRPLDLTVQFVHILQYFFQDMLV